MTATFEYTAGKMETNYGRFHGKPKLKLAGFMEFVELTVFAVIIVNMEGNVLVSQVIE